MSTYAVIPAENIYSLLAFYVFHGDYNRYGLIAYNLITIIPGILDCKSNKKHL